MALKKLLVTGASGFLGWNICNIAKKDWNIYGTACSHPIEIDGVNIIKADLTDFKELKKLFREVRASFDVLLNILETVKERVGLIKIHAYE